MATLPPARARWLLALGCAALTITAACTTTEVAPDASGDPNAPDDLDETGGRGADATTKPDDDDVDDDDGDGDGGAPIARREAGTDATSTDARADLDATVECGPPGHVFTNAQGPFCPFQAGGVFDHCAVADHCCQYAEALGKPSVCRAGATACDVEIATGFDWRCDERNDCPGGQVCCFAGAITPHPYCADRYSTSPDVHATACRPVTCAADETQTCGSQADCPLGTTCTGMRLRGKHFGFCKP